MLSKRQLKLRTLQSGQNLAEFALIFPVLALILFGVLDLGRLFHAAIAVANASREGARYAMSYPDATDEIYAVTKREAAGVGVVLTDDNIEVTCPDGCVKGTPVEVTVTYDFQLILAMVVPSGKIPIVQSTQMMVP